MSKKSPPRTRNMYLGVFVALVIGVVASLPQLHARLIGGQQWKGSFVSYYFDEPAYLVYLQALIDGQPRRTDPYTGRYELAQQSESLFSIQFLPAYALAIAARTLGLSSSEAFIALRTIAALGSALTLFWFLQTLTRNAKAAALGTLIVLCLGSYAGSPKPLRSLVELDSANFDFPFLRCYVPALPFPIFFIFCTAICKALARRGRTKSLAWSGLAGACFSALVFSYFFLWTAAAAWLICLVLVRISNSAQSRSRSLTTAGVVGAIGLCSLIPYTLLLLERSPGMDAAQLLSNSRLPDLIHRSEFLGIILIIVLVLAIRHGLINRKHYLNGIIISFALLPVLVFNQQVITGHSLQPHHYEYYITPYAVTLAAYLTALLLLRRHSLFPSLAGRRNLIASAIAIVIVARAVGTTLITSSQAIVADGVNGERVAVMRTMYRELVRKEWPLPSRPLVFFVDLRQADTAPAIAPYLVLWSPHMFVFPGTTATENKERLYRYLYFSGVSPENFQSMASVNSYLSLALFGFERSSMQDNASKKPISATDVFHEQQSYSRYLASFGREDAAALKVDYVVTSTRNGPDLSNFDRWYQRLDGHSFGEFTIWRVSLR